MPNLQSIFVGSFSCQKTHFGNIRSTQRGSGICSNCNATFRRRLLESLSSRIFFIYGIANKRTRSDGQPLIDICPGFCSHSNRVLYWGKQVCLCREATVLHHVACIMAYCYIVLTESCRTFSSNNIPLSNRLAQKAN